MDSFKKYAQDQTAQLILSFVLGLLVGIGIHMLWASAPAVAPADNDQEGIELSDSNGNGSTTVITDSNGVIVEDQQPGNTVTISQVVLEEPSWIAIADDENGQPGRILGAQLFDAGKTSGTVDLLRKTEVGKSYFAVIRTDAGASRRFESKTDLPLTRDDRDEIIMTRFTIVNNK